MGEIAKKLGFSSQQHFSRQFRTVTGMTPSEYVRACADRRGRVAQITGFNCCFFLCSAA